MSSSKSRSSNRTSTTDKRTTGTTNLGVEGDVEDTSLQVISGVQGNLTLSDAGAVEESFQFASEALGAANNLAELSLGSLAAVKSGEYKQQPKTIDNAVNRATDTAIKVVVVGAGAYVIGQAIKRSKAKWV